MQTHIRPDGKAHPGSSTQKRGWGRDWRSQEIPAVASTGCLYWPPYKISEPHSGFMYLPGTDVGPSAPPSEWPLYRQKYKKNYHVDFHWSKLSWMVFVGFVHWPWKLVFVGIKANYCSGNSFNWILNIVLHFKNRKGHLLIIAFIPLPEEQVMHLIKLDIPYSCTSIVAHPWASTAICKNSRKSKNLCMAWKNDCGLRSGTFLVFVQSNVIFYTLEQFSKLCKNTFPSTIKAAKSNQND